MFHILQKVVSQQMSLQAVIEDWDLLAFHCIMQI